MYDVIIVGGGLAGLINSILLSRGGLRVLLFEKNSYPFHRVCGEYISNEVIPFLEKHELFPTVLEPSAIDQLTISATSGRSFHMPLDLGGFGISRYQLDHWLVNKSRDSGTQLLEGVRIQNIQRDQKGFNVSAHSGEVYQSKLVIIAHGKRSKLDQTLDRGFIKRKSPYVGVKYHIKTDFDEDRIALHNFEGGYCGLSKVEQDTYNLCYLIHRDPVRKYGSIEATEQAVLMENPHLKAVFQNSEFLFQKPEVINEITFEKKEAVYEGMLMSGDSAGMITPLCGNGMAMAIHSAKALSEIVLANYNSGIFDMPTIYDEYTRKWNGLFARRLWAGRKIQSLFGGKAASELAVLTGRYAKPIAQALIKKTHGEPFS